MFEYPSESSLEGQEVEEEEEEAEEEEEEEEEEYASEVDQAPPLPAAKRKEGRSGPGFSTQKPPPGQGGEFEAAPPRAGTVAPGADPPGARVMLTPAGAGDRSDFGSEPALYF
uniref:taperin-like n=1 Tax=Podarcis muralis TaxID=64176 RepID=UPI00109F009A|nr:taperin-like [Podarcis muralis]